MEQEKEKQGDDGPGEVSIEKLTVGNDNGVAAKATAPLKNKNSSPTKVVYQRSSVNVKTAEAEAGSAANLSEAPTEDLTIDQSAAENRKVAFGGSAAAATATERFSPAQEEGDYLSGSRVGAYRVGVSHEEERINSPGILIPAPVDQDSMRMVVAQGGGAPSGNRHAAGASAVHTEVSSLTSGSIYTSPSQPSIHAQLVKPPAYAVAETLPVATPGESNNTGNISNDNDQQGGPSSKEVEDLRNQVNRNTNRNTMLVVLLIVLIVLAIAVGVTVTMMVVGGGDDDESPSPGPGGDGTAPSVFTAAPVAPTPKPTPTAPLDRAQVEYQIKLKSPTTDFDAVGTPQRLALDWLVSDAYSNGRMQAGDLTKVLQRFGLAVFYFATNGKSSWDLSTNWLNGSDECDSWFGIRCNQGGLVSQFNLQSNQIQGAIPVELLIFTQDSLALFNLARNDIVETIPSNIGSMRGLMDLRLFENSLEGTIPTEIASLGLLRHLAINLNQLSGSVPPMRDLGLLTYLDIRDNAALRGPLPDNGFEGLASIEEIYIFGTDLTGSLSNELCDTLNTAWIDCGQVMCDCCTGDLGYDCPTPAPEPTSTPLPTAMISTPKPAVAPVEPIETPSPLMEATPAPANAGTPIPTMPVQTPSGSTPNPTLQPTVDREKAILREVLERNGVTVKTDSSTQGQAFHHMVADPFFVNNDQRMVQRYALLVLWFGTDGPYSWDQMPWIDDSGSGWASSSDHCTWSRIECFDNSLIHKIRLNCGDDGFCRGIRGQLPTELGLIQSMKLVDFHFNAAITGTIPREIGSLTALTWLDLNGLTGLDSGPVPDYLFVPSLEWLGISNSRYTGYLPTSINDLDNLRNVFLFDNDFTGGNLNGLCDTLEEPAAIDCDDTIECECCREGDALWNFGADCPRPNPAPTTAPTTELQATIKALLEQNGVTVRTDSSPQGQAFRHMVEDSFFVDNGQRLTQRYALLVLWFATDGSASWSQMPWIDDTGSGWASSSDHCSWSRIECFENSLIHKIRLNCGDVGFCAGIRGQLPTELGLVTTMKLLDFHFHTAITGTIPVEIGRLTALTWLDLNGVTGLNSGSIPGYLFVPSLEFLGLSNSGYTGSVPATINNLDNLKELYLFDNDLTGGTLNQLCDTLEERAAVDCDDGIDCDCCREGDALWNFGADCPAMR